MPSSIELHELTSVFLPEPVEYALVTPPGYRESDPVPLCILLMGGGGSRQSLLECQPLFDRWWLDGSLAPMVLATPSPGMSYYIDDAARRIEWGAWLADAFLEHLRATCRVSRDRSRTAIAGISMGGYGALKTAFAFPDRFGVVAAMQPMLEPGLRAADVGPRNTLHHVSGGPGNLIGAGRDAAVFEANNPANRAIANREAIERSGLAIYMDAGDRDFTNAHDGAEFLHRVLWNLDLSHEYRLIRGGDHGGATLVPRMHDALAWTSAAMTASADDGPYPMAAARAQLAPAREQAARVDPTTGRRFGVMKV